MSSKNSSQALFYCILLALQFGLQPLLVTRFTSSGISKISLVIGTEIGKILLSITSIRSETEADRKKIFGNWSLFRSLKLAALPATLYAIQNLSIQYSYMYLDSMSFNLLSQTKTLSAAFWLWIVMGQKQSYIQIAALLLLLAAAVLLNLSTDHSSNSKNASASLTDYNLGLFWCILASSISGLSGALVQKAVTGPHPQHSLLYTAELATYGISFLLVSSLFSEKDRAVLLSGTLFNGWTANTFIPVTANAFGGLIVGMVTKYAGGVVKGFALIAGIVVTGVAQWVLEGKALQTKDYVAVVLVSFAIYLHGSFPPSKLPVKSSQQKSVQIPLTQKDGQTPVRKSNRLNKKED